MKVYSALFAVVVGSVQALLAGAWVDGTWTGAEDGFFTNANNWASGQVPGRYLVPDDSQVDGVATNGAKGATVTFGDDLTGNAVTTIDFDGVFSVTNLIVTAKTHRYTFGTKSEQYIPIESRGTFNGGATPDTLVPTLACRLRVGVLCDSTGYGSDFHIFRNNSTETLVIGDFGYIINPRSPDNKLTGNEFGYRFYGSGSIRFTKERSSNGNGNSHINDYLTGTLYLDARFPFRNFNVYNETSADYGKVRHIVIGENGRLENAAGFYAAIATSANAPVEISGPGLLRQSGAGNASSSYNPHVKSGMFQVSAPITVSSRMDLTMSYPTGYESFVPGLWIVGGDKTLMLNCPEEGNTVRGLFRFTSTAAGATLALPRIGLRGTYGAHGDEDFSFINKGRLLYTGPGETMDRAICFTNQLAQYKDTSSKTAYPAAGTLEQGGTGDLRVESAVTLSGPSAGTFTLANSVAADGIFAGSIEGGITVEKTGSGRWKYAAPLTYTGATKVLAGTLYICKGASFASSSGVSLADGADLVFEGDSADPVAVACPALTVTAGAATLHVGAGCTLTLAGLTTSGSILNVITEDETAKVKVAGQGAGDASATLLFNGRPAAFDAEGNLKKFTVTVTTTVPVKGGVIPNDAAAGVGIVDGGTAGNVTLAADATSVRAVVQQASEPATVTLAEGQALTAATLAIDEGKADLTVNAAANGAVKAAAGTFTVWPERADATITVNAPADLSSATDLNLNGQGTARFTGGMTFAGTATLQGGELAVTATQSGVQNFALAGAGTFAQEGESVVTVSKPSPNFAGDYVVRSGTVQPGAADASKLFGVSGDLVLTNGATLRIFGENTSVTYGTKRLRLADGARVEINKNEALNTPPFRQLRLDGDATVAGTVEKGSKDFNLVGQKDGVRGTVDLAGHTLTKSDYGRLGFNSVDFISGGTLHFTEKPGFTAVGGGNLLIAAGQINLPAEEKVTLKAENGTSVCLSGLASPLQMPWEIHGTNYLCSWTQGRVATNINNWAGPITLADANSQLVFYMYNDSYRQAVVSGRISGEGSVRLCASTSGTAGRVYLAAPVNDFTGNMDFFFPNGSGSYGAVAFARSTTIPDFSKLRLRNYGAAVLPITADGTAWPFAKVGRLLREATFENYAIAALDLVNTGDFAMNISELGTAPTGVSGFGRQGFATDTHTLTVNIDTDWEAPSTVLGCYNGTLRFTGDGTHHIRSKYLRVSGDNSVSTGMVEIAQNAEVRVENVSVGQNDATLAHLRILSGGILCGKDGPSSRAWMSLAGCTRARGVLKQEGGEVYANIQVGSGDNAYGGAYFQDGGLFSSAGGESYLGQRSHGYWCMTGGSAVFAGDARLNLACFTNVPATLVLRGGTMSFTGTQAPVMLGGKKLAHSHILLKGGNLVFKTAYTGSSAQPRAMELPWSSPEGYDSTAVVTLDDVASCLSITNTQNMFLANQTNGLAIVNLNAGVLEAGDIWACGNGYPGSEAYLNFNGGTLRATKDTSAWTRGLTRVEVGPAGAVMDTAGFNATFAQPLVRPAGQGVVAVPWPENDKELNSVVDIPFAVRIVGDGSGASAVIEYDRVAKRMTGIRIVSAGSGYTTATARITSGQTRIYNYGYKLEIPCTLGAASVSGGFTKKGAGTLTLSSANSWEGATVVEGGLLKLGVEGALPAGSAVTLKGGGIAVAEGVAMPSTLDVELTAAQLADEKAHYTLLSYPGALPETLPTLNYTDEVPVGPWAVLRENNALVLRRVSGTSIYFR